MKKNTEVQECTLVGLLLPKRDTLEDSLLQEGKAHIRVLQEGKARNRIGTRIGFIVFYFR